MQIKYQGTQTVVDFRIPRYSNQPWNHHELHPESGIGTTQFRRELNVISKFVDLS